MPNLLSGLAIPAFALIVTSCVQQAPAPAPQGARPPGYASERYTPPGFALPSGDGCRGDVGRFRAVMSNDYQTGNVNLSVYKSITAEIDQADQVCASGDATRASAMIRATRAKFGYP